MSAPAVRPEVRPPGPGIHPLIPPAAGLVAGLVSGSFIPGWSWPPPLFLGAAGAGLAWTLFRAGRARRFPPFLLIFSLFLLGLGLAAWQASQSPGPADISLEADNQIHQLKARVLEAPEPGPRQWNLVLEALALDGALAEGRLDLDLDRGLEPPPAGAVVRARVRLKPITSFENPGSFDYAGYMERRGVRVRAFAGRTSGFAQVDGAGEDGLRHALENARGRLGRLLDSLPPEPGRELLRALTLGQKAGLDPGVRDAFGDTGTAHLLAISGLHLAMVWGWSFLVFRLALGAWPGLALRLPAPKAAAALALLPALGYAALAGFSTPTLRALCMALCLAAALAVDRPYRPSGALALAAMVIGLLWPQAPLTLSFQLSFIAVASILLAGGPLLAFLGRGQGWVGRTWRGLLAWAGVSAAVGLAVLPMEAEFFHVLPLLFLPANLLLVPLATFLVLPPALLGAAAALVWAPAGLWLWQAALAPAGWAVELVQWLAGIPGAAVYLGGPGIPALVFCYAALLAAFIPWKGRWPAAGGLAAAAVLAVWLHNLPPKPDGALRAWALDVGQGTATVIGLPRGGFMVVDGGGWASQGFDFGRRVMAPFLWALGADSLEVMAASHSHPDHTGGLPFLLGPFRPREVWTNGGTERKGWYGRLLAGTEREGLSPLGPADLLGEEREMDGARIRVLWPPAGGEGGKLPENDRSLWLGVGLGECWLWLPGDNGPQVERAVLPLLPREGRHVLLAPHHAGRGSCSRELLERLRPDMVLISCGCPNSFNMPNPAVLARLEKAGTPHWSTARWGTLALKTDGRAWSLERRLAEPRECGAGNQARPVANLVKPKD